MYHRSGLDFIYLSYIPSRSTHWVLQADAVQSYSKLLSYSETKTFAITLTEEYNHMMCTAKIVHISYTENKQEFTIQLWSKPTGQEN